MGDANSAAILTSSPQKRRVELNGTVTSDDLDVSRRQRLLNNIEARMMMSNILCLGSSPTWLV